MPKVKVSYHSNIHLNFICSDLSSDPVRNIGAHIQVSLKLLWYPVCIWDMHVCYYGSGNLHVIVTIIDNHDTEMIIMMVTPWTDTKSNVLQWNLWILILCLYDNGDQNNNNDTLKKDECRQFWDVHLIFSSYCIVFDAEIKNLFRFSGGSVLVRATGISVVDFSMAIALDFLCSRDVAH